MDMSEERDGGAFPLEQRGLVPQGKLSYSLHNKENGYRTDKNDRCPLQLCDLGDFFVMCMSFPLSILPAPWIARTIFIYSVSSVRPITGQCFSQPPVAVTLGTTTAFEPRPGTGPMT